jgi:hypothetical protein
MVQELGYSRNLHEFAVLCLLQGRVAGLLQPRPFLNKMSNALVSIKFCERHTDPQHCFIEYLTVLLLQERLGEFGLSTSGLVGLTSDGASVMVATGRIMKIIHQLCLGRYIKVCLEYYVKTGVP